MNKNTRWALAIVGVAILVIAAVIIGTSGDETNAPETDDTPPATQSPDDGATAETGATGAPADDGDSTSGGDTGGTPAEPGDDTGGTSPGDTGGASPDDGGSEGSGGAEAGASSVVVLRSGTVKTVKAKKGDEVVFKVRASEPDELHIHGYDKTVEVPANKTVTVRFKAKIDGVFDIEFHHSDEKVGTLKVTP